MSLSILEKLLTKQSSPQSHLGEFCNLSHFLFGKLAMGLQPKRRKAYLTLLLTSLFLSVDGSGIKNNQQVAIAQTTLPSDSCPAIPGGIPPEPDAISWTDGNYSLYTIGNNSNAQGSQESGFAQAVANRGGTLTTLNSNNDFSFTGNTGPGSAAASVGTFSNGTLSFSTNYTTTNRAEFRTTTFNAFVSGNSGDSVYIFPEQGGSAGDFYTVSIDFTNPVEAFSFDLVDIFDTLPDNNPVIRYEVYADGQLIAYFRGPFLGDDQVGNTNLFDGSGTLMGSVPTGQNLENTIGFLTDVPVSNVSIRHEIESGTILSTARDPHGFDYFSYSISFPECVPDRSDAPTSYGAPAHVIVSGTHLGAIGPDEDATDQPTTAANGDDNDGTDDEDGVLLGSSDLQGQSLTTGSSVMLDVTTQGSGVLNAWFDWNGDGDFDETNEQVATNATPSGGTIALNVTVPAGATVGDTYARFRYSSDTDLGPTGTASDGEVEDYQVAIAASSLNISGRVFEDIIGNVLDGGETIGDANNPVVDNVTVILYKDDGDNVPNAADTQVDTVQTDVAGAYTFSNVDDNSNYWVVVDSKTIAPSAGFNGGSDQGDIWAEQVYGVTGGLVADGAGGTTTLTAGGPAFGGRRGDVSDDASGANTAEHITGVSVSGADVTDIDYGFSFNVVTGIRDNGDDDGAADRSIQGSLRQFMQNANAIDSTASTGATARNDMRFTPTVPTNGTGSWWSVSLTTALPRLTDIDTTVDGTAYDRTDGVTVRDDNSGAVTTPNGGVVGTGSDGVLGTGDESTLPAYNYPEFEIESNGRTGSSNGVVELDANNLVIEDLVVYDGGDGIKVISGDNNLIQRNFIGVPADGSDPDPTSGDGGNAGISSIATLGDDFTVQNNYIRNNRYVGLENNSGAAATITGNSLINNGYSGACTDALSVQGHSTPAIITGNYIEGADAFSIETFGHGGGLTIEDNTITGGGRVNEDCDGADEAGGVRLFGNNSTVRHNQIFNNNGVGIVVRQSTGNLISQNSFYDNIDSPAVTDGGRTDGLGIDLYDSATGRVNPAGDGVTPNNGTTSSGVGNGGIDFPVFESAELTGNTLTIVGWAPAGATVELFLADNNPASAPVVPASPNPPDTFTLGGAGTTFTNSFGFGEGETYLTTLVEGAGGDADATTSSYSDDGTGVSGSITQERFEFTVDVTTLPGTVSVGTHVTATATVANSTSEFSGVIPVTTTTSAPDVVLVKRITAINGNRAENTNNTPAKPLNAVVNDGVANSADDEANWPAGYLVGEVDAGLVQPGDEIEYTVYFLNAGGGEAEDVRICDWIQPNQSFVTGKYGGNDIELVTGGSTYQLTATSDAVDRAEITTVGSLPATPDCNLSVSASASDEVVVVDITGTTGDPTGLTTFPNTTGQGTPNNAYGYFRFTTKVDE